MWRTLCQDGVKTIVNSVKAQGVLPNKFMYVQDDGDGTYTVMDGIHRYLAFTELGIKIMQVLVFPHSISKEEFEILSSAANDEYDSWTVSFFTFYLIC